MPAYVLVESLRRLGLAGTALASRHYPAETTENRLAGAHHRAPHLGALQLRLSLAVCFRRGLDSAALLKRRKIKPCRALPEALEVCLKNVFNGNRNDR